MCVATSFSVSYYVVMTEEPKNLLDASDRTAISGEELKKARQAVGWTTGSLAEHAAAVAAADGYTLRVSQQTVSGFEQGTYKRVPGWLPYARAAIRRQEALENNEFRTMIEGEEYAAMGVKISALPTFAGAGGGGTGEGDTGTIIFSRSLVENQLRAKPADLLAIEIEGNSMSPDFESGDQLLIDKRKTSIAQPGAFCLWDGDGYVVKYLEKVYDTEPAKVRVISRNAVFSAAERLADEIQILGRVVWFARRV